MLLGLLLSALGFGLDGISSPFEESIEAASAAPVCYGPCACGLECNYPDRISYSGPYNYVCHGKVEEGLPCNTGYSTGQTVNPCADG